MTQRRAFFFYEQLATGNWAPVITYDEPPQQKDGFQISSNGKDRRITKPIELSAEDFSMENEPLPFSMLQRLYPMKGKF